MQTRLILVSSFMLCTGCNDAAGRHQADQARQQQTVNELREIGLEMHETHDNQVSKSPADATTTDASESNSDSLPNDVNLTE